MHNQQAEVIEKILDQSFVTFLQRQLTLAIGPMAEIIIQEVVEDLGYDLFYFPSNEAATLVDFISREILREKNKEVFKAVMYKKIEAEHFISH
jgi:hypothetical protein